VHLRAKIYKAFSMIQFGVVRCGSVWFGKEEITNPKPSKTADKAYQGLVTTYL
jgi:hypothetical protein